MGGKIACVCENSNTCAACTVQVRGKGGRGGEIVSPILFLVVVFLTFFALFFGIGRISGSGAIVCPSTVELG